VLRCSNNFHFAGTVFTTLWDALWRILLLTFGVWTKSMERSVCLRGWICVPVSQSRPEGFESKTLWFCSSFRITFMAQEWDDDPDDANNKQETVRCCPLASHKQSRSNMHCCSVLIALQVIHITARSRGVLWVFFPGTALFWQ
jgi:hypothetical protein